MAVKRDEVVPEDLVAHLQKTIPGFRKEAMHHQLALASMVWTGSSKRRQHESLEGAMSFYCRELEDAFGRGGFKEINKRLEFFISTGQWFRDSGETKGYWFTDRVKESRDTYLARRWRKVTRLLKADGTVMKTIPAAVAGKDMLGVNTTAWTNAKELNVVRVDLASLERLRRWLAQVLADYDDGRVPHDLATEFPAREDVERLAHATGQIIRLAKTDVAGNGYIAHRYVQATTGRLYAKGVNLQNAPSLIKQAALAGLWEYDFSNCHFAIIAQMAQQHGYQCKAIARYLADKKATRRVIAAQAGISDNQAKVCLLAVMYGARLSEWHENAIPEAIGQEAAARLFKVAQFKAIADDVAAARRAILKGWPRTAAGRLTNAFGKAIDGKARAVEQMAHLVQGVEAKALQTAIDLYPNKIVLLQHDGFASTSKLNVGVITEAVFQATGYRLELEEDRIRVDPDAHFLKNRILFEMARQPNNHAGLRDSLAH
ncbi:MULTISPECIES: hypothetical protein [Giesbergeria]|uniref:Uncharacterized protein n=1 Tax=Giesbergeria sinuosa TaxID=80883 RepID=A0ABV9QEK4_9BURK